MKRPATNDDVKCHVSKWEFLRNSDYGGKPIPHPEVVRKAARELSLGENWGREPRLRGTCEQQLDGFAARATDLQHTASAHGRDVLPCFPGSRTVVNGRDPDVSR